MRCDDLVFQIDTNNNQVRYRTRATWWRSRLAHNPQRSNGAGPPCHPRTPPKAAQPTAQSPQPEKRSMGIEYEMLTSTLELFNQLPGVYSSRQGQERGFQPSARCAVPRYPYWMRKARSLSTRLGPARPLGHPPGRSNREPSDHCWYMFWAQGITTQRAGPLFRQTEAWGWRAHQAPAGEIFPRVVVHLSFFFFF